MLCAHRRARARICTFLSTHAVKFVAASSGCILCGILLPYASIYNYSFSSDIFF